MMKKIFAMACALCLTTAMFTSCGESADTGSESKAEAATTTTAAEEEKPEETEAPAETEAPEETEAPAESEAPAEEGGDSAIDEVTGLEMVKPDTENYTPVTEFQGYDAFLMFANMGAGGADWYWENMAGQGYPEDQRGMGAFGVDADVVGDGTYTVAITADSMGANDAVLGEPNVQAGIDEETGYIWPSLGAVVFCVDITGICDGTTTLEGEATKESDQKKFAEGDDYGVNKMTKGKYTGQEITATIDSIKADGVEVEFDPSKVVCGNIESNNNCYRLEIYNDYGKTKDAPAIDQKNLKFAKSLEVTFTISGLDKE